MRSLYIGVSKANMIDDAGRLWSTFRNGKGWIFEGKAYKSPFDAFKVLEQGLATERTGQK